MKIEILEKEKAEEIKNRFKEKFLLTWKEYKTQNNEWIKIMTGNNFSLSLNMIHKYERMAISDEITFDSALNILRKKEGDVYFMSEDADYPESCEVVVDGVPCKDGVFKANARMLAELIESQWAKFSEDEGAELVIPCNLYVFDEKMKKALAFSDELYSFFVDTDDGEQEIETRLCFKAKARSGK
jgi:hypothetical protein